MKTSESARIARGTEGPGSAPFERGLSDQAQDAGGENEPHRFGVESP